MARYHITKAGNPGVCKAKRKCPFGDIEKDHFNSKEEAQAAYEKRQKHEEKLPKLKKQAAQEEKPKPAPLAEDDLTFDQATEELLRMAAEAKNEDDRDAIEAVSSKLAMTQQMGFEGEVGESLFRTSMMKDLQAVEAGGYCWTQAYRQATMVASRARLSAEA